MKRRQALKVIGAGVGAATVVGLPLGGSPTPPLLTEEMLVNSCRQLYPELERIVEFKNGWLYFTKEATYFVGPDDEVKEWR